MALTCLLWPHLALLHARLARDPHRAESRNLLIDSAIAGAWVPLMHFCLLPSVLLVMVTTFDKISTGIRGLWLRSLPVMVGTALLLTLWLRPAPQWDASLLVVLCSLPLLIAHTLAVSMSSHRLIRTVARQNHLLEELRRMDAHTGLLGREPWMQMAVECHEAFRASGQAATRASAHRTSPRAARGAQRQAVPSPGSLNAARASSGRLAMCSPATPASCASRQSSAGPGVTSSRLHGPIFSSVKCSTYRSNRSSLYSNSCHDGTNWRFK